MAPMAVTRTTQRAKPPRSVTAALPAEAFEWPTRRTRSARGLSPRERAMLVLLTVVLVACALASRPNTPAHVDTIRVKVTYGDTLWRIAEANRLPGLSTAETADYIVRINHLTTSKVVAGHELQVPRAADGRGRVALR
jgi:hypothetical protein